MYRENLWKFSRIKYVKLVGSFSLLKNKLFSNSISNASYQRYFNICQSKETGFRGKKFKSNIRWDDFWMSTGQCKTIIHFSSGVHRNKTFTHIPRIYGIWNFVRFTVNSHCAYMYNKGFGIAAGAASRARHWKYMLLIFLFFASLCINCVIGTQSKLNIQIQQLLNLRILRLENVLFGNNMLNEIADKMAIYGATKGTSRWLFQRSRYKYTGCRKQKWRGWITTEIKVFNLWRNFLIHKNILKVSCLYNTDVLIELS